MPKKIRFESFTYRFLVAAQSRRFHLPGTEQPSWATFVRALEFSYEKGEVRIAWTLAKPGHFSTPLDQPRFCLRGDSALHIARQKASGSMDAEDPIKLRNEAYFGEVVLRVAQSAGYEEISAERAGIAGRLAKERAFHDAWADGEDAGKIDVRASNEVCTAPEMRYITRRLGDLRGRRLLDVGCGLGEASVYFALKGADVTSADLSQGMLDATSRLAQANGVNVTRQLATAEDMQLPPGARFDVIYAGNLLHHVDIGKTIARIKPHLAPGGIFVAWDPLAYNPAINVYRVMATKVRTPDEHPLKWGDIKSLRGQFGTVETRYFWLTTLIIFVIMALAQRRDPNKERYWKVVVQEGRKWRWLYLPLEVLDRLLLMLVPPLRLLCWNVVIMCKP